MQCPLCRRRQARRACPALSRDICPVCCGTKRLVEISCRPDCGYLASAQAHPAAVVRKQQERDTGFVAAFMTGLTTAQQELAWGVLGLVSRFGADPLLRLEDEDVADMAASLASTLETAARGVIYEHRPRSLMAQRLTTEVKTLLDQAGAQGGRGFERDAAAVLGRVAATFRDAGKVFEQAGRAAGLAAVARVLREAGDAARANAGGQRITPPGPALIRP